MHVAAAPVYVTALEESILSLALESAAHIKSESEAEEFLSPILSGRALHAARLKTARLLYLGVEPGMAIGATILLLVERLVRKPHDLGQPGAIDVLLDSVGAKIDAAWQVRQRSLYVDWTDAGWTDPGLVSEEAVAALRRMTSRFVRAACRMTRPNQEVDAATLAGAVDDLQTHFGPRAG